MTKPRVIISTDIGGDDKDDGQSFIHALLYANDVDYRGFVPTTSDVGPLASTWHMNRIIDAYAQDLPNLRETGDYPAAPEMRALIRQGATSPDWPGTLSDGARLIIEEARAASKGDPLYVLGWGPIHDIAAALKAAPDIADSIRVYSIYGQGQDRAHPDAYNWMKSAVSDDGRYADLFWINADESFRGMYVSGSGQSNPNLNMQWVEDNVDGHGALGNLFHDAYSKDLYGNGSGVNGLKMGDTPSLLYLLDDADNDNPGAASWGGRFARNGWGNNTWDDRDGSADRLGNYDGARTVYEKRGEAWGDFAARLDRAENGDGKNAAPAEELTNESAPAFSGATIGVERMQAESFDLSGGYVEEARSASSGGANIMTLSKGAASAVFDGASGRYTIDTGWLNEDDGAASFSLSVNGQAVKSWTGVGGSNAEAVTSVTVNLARGDTIELTGQKGAYEYARVDWMEISQAGPSSGNSAPTPAPVTPPPAFSGATIGVERMQAESFDLSGGYVEEARSASSGGANIMTLSKGAASAVFDGASGRYTIDTGWLNEDDGAASFSLSVNGQAVKSWTGVGGSNAEAVTSVTVNLARGDTIELTGQKGAYEYARVDWMEISQAGPSSGNSAPTPAPVTPAPVEPSPAPVDIDLVVFAGQSNATGHFYPRPGDTGTRGADVFERALEAMTGEDVRLVNAGTSGSGSNQYADSKLYWWDVDGDRPGPELLKAMSVIRSAEASGHDVDAFIWAQGEDDARSVGSGGGNQSLAMSRFDESTRSVFDYVRAELDDPDLPIFIQEIGNWPDVPPVGSAAARGVHESITRSMADVYIGARTTDVDEHYDSGHFNNDGYGIIAERLADSVFDILG